MSGIQGLALEVRFWMKVRKSEGCWTWGDAPAKTGYGRIGIGADTVLYAHRVSWEIHYGPIPEGMLVCHHCDNRICVRPDHLFLGTDADNMQDMWRKGRGYSPPKGGPQSRGSGYRKLTWEA